MGVILKLISADCTYHASTPKQDQATHVHVKRIVYPTTVLRWEIVRPIVRYPDKEEIFFCNQNLLRQWHLTIHA